MDGQYSAAYAALYQNHWWWRVRETILLRQLADVIKTRGPARILDVGCGAGLFFDALAQFGHVEGIESDAALAHGAGPWRDRIRVGELDASFCPDGPFDAILMLDVLEHVPNPRQMLIDGKRVLHREGRVVITVPAFECLWTSHDDLNHHLRRYTADQLAVTIREAGLMPEHVSYLFPSLFIPKLWVRAVEAVKGATPHIPTIPKRPVNALLRKWFQAEFAVSRRLPFGTSVIAVARIL